MLEIVSRDSQKIRLTIAPGRITLKVPTELTQQEIDKYATIAQGLAIKLQNHTTLRGAIRQANFTHEGHSVYIWCSKKIAVDATGQVTILPRN